MKSELQLDYYQALGIKRSASKEDIRKAYRKLARQYHPDLISSFKTSAVKIKKLEDQFNIITTAYEILGNPEKRASYDAKFKIPQAKKFANNQPIIVNELQTVINYLTNNSLKALLSKAKTFCLRITSEVILDLKPLANITKDSFSGLAAAIKGNHQLNERQLKP
ncbi:MAG TPA: DnaJ domain-containing protein [Oligoflexia bacterium]|nr:DnaJ domain-containing protein [Oligoflexia bacterium]HMP26540.1 DnaJ domain-containing protein [Oligoflexia bacterium]